MTQNRTAALTEHLRTQIADGAVAPGEKLPSEAALLAEHGVSRTVVREALGRLQAEGLIRTRRGAGSFALTPPAETTTPGTRGVRTVEDRLRLVEFRIGLETETAALAAERRTATHLTALRAELDAFNDAENMPAHAMHHDFRLHRMIAEASANPFLLDAINGLGSVMITMPRARITTSGTARSASASDASHHLLAAREHEQILAAVDARDARGAAAAMRSHLTSSRTRLLADHD